LKRYDHIGLHDVARELDRLNSEVKELNEKQKDLYTQEVQGNPKAQTYLYAPYSFKMRYYKLGSMFQKVALVAILLFVPPRLIRGAKMWCGSALILLQSFCATLFQPFSDGMETLMEIFAGFTNVINCMVGLLITYGIGPAALHDTILISVNVFNLLVILFTLIIGPLRTHLFLKAFRQKEKLLHELQLKTFAREQALKARQAVSNRMKPVTDIVVEESGKDIADKYLRRIGDSLKSMGHEVSDVIIDINSSISEQSERKYNDAANMIEEIKTDVDTTVNELNAEVQKAKRDVDAAKARLESAVGSIAKAEAEQFINDTESRFQYAKARLEATEQALGEATGAVTRLGGDFKASSEAHLEQIYAKTLPLVEKVKSATETITSNLGDYSDFLGEAELSKLAVGASGVNVQDLSSSYWSEPEEFDSAGEFYGGSDLSSYISSSDDDVGTAH